MPGFPGAAWSSSTAGSRPSFHASACSRPPDPTISTFTGGESTAAVGAFPKRFKGDRPRHLLAVTEPGLDRHEWETQWQALEPLVADSPAEALPELNGLVERMMVERGYPVDEEHEFEAPEAEVVKEFLEARRVARLVDAGERVDPSDVGAAIAGYRNVYDYLFDRYVGCAAGGDRGPGTRFARPPP